MTAKTCLTQLDRCLESIAPCNQKRPTEKCKLHSMAFGLLWLEIPRNFKIHWKWNSIKVRDCLFYSLLYFLPIDHNKYSRGICWMNENRHIWISGKSYALSPQKNACSHVDYTAHGISRFNLLKPIHGTRKLWLLSHEEIAFDTLHDGEE